MKNDLGVIIITAIIITSIIVIILSEVIAFTIEYIDEKEKFNHSICKYCSKKIKLIYTSGYYRIYTCNTCQYDLLIHNYIVDYKYLKELNILKG